MGSVSERKSSAFRQGMPLDINFRAHFCRRVFVQWYVATDVFSQLLVGTKIYLAHTWLIQVVDDHFGIELTIELWHYGDPSFSDTRPCLCLNMFRPQAMAVFIGKRSWSTNGWNGLWLARSNSQRPCPANPFVWHWVVRANRAFEVCRDHTSHLFKLAVEDGLTTFAK